jgi:KaiC/GvpD/RAD55 family RecA-like ATPase|tara:strand:- start:24027 stop:25757 length:1731 start_codon:yes stop_codon:yes gene_type:complete
VNFIKHVSCEKCGSSDAKAVYEGGSSHCFACEFTIPSQDFKEQNPSKNKRVRNNPKKEEEKMEIKTNSKPAMTSEENAVIKSETGVHGKNFRFLRDSTTKPFGIRYAYDYDTEDVIEQYYPVTQEGQIVGYKIREVPKNFFSKGRTGADCELFMQFKFNRGGKYVMITEGELDALSAYQMISDYNKSKNSDFETAVVSPTTGAQSHKQIAAQYKFLDSFDQIIVAYDNDKAGKDATEKLLTVLPKGKVKIMHMRFKDANEYLEKGEDKAFVSDFYNAKTHVPVGVVGSGEISDSMRQEFMTPKIPLPPFMHKLQDMMSGGIPLGRIVNLASASGTGKSTIVDEIVYYMLFNSPHKVGIVTLESTTGQYGNKLLSRHIGLKLELKTNEQALEILASDKVKKKEKELFWTDSDEHRFYLIDDRDGGVDNVKDAIENLVISCGCKVIVLDPTHDVIGTLPNEEQESFYSWQKGMVKSHNCTFYNVMHTRKTANGQKSGSTGADLSEEDIQGSSSAYKSAACNLMFSRNKESEDAIERNTTTMKATKIRWSGRTGVAGKYYYDNDSHTMYDLDDYLNNNH